VQRARLQPAQGDPGDFAGMSVALAGNHAVLGSGNQSKPFEDRKVHVFNRRPNTSWLQSATLNDPDPLPESSNNSDFGRALAIHGDMLFVSAPYAEWRGQRGGVVYPYRYNGSIWDAMAPIVPPPGGSQFGAGMTVHNGWLFISQFMESSSTKPDQIFAYRLADPINREPLFVTQPPVLVVSGRASSFEVRVEDPDGNAGLVFRPANLPPGLTLQDLGNGRATIAGIPTDPAGTERWLRIAVADAQGSEAVQTSLVEVLSINDLPVLGGLPGSLEIEEGEDIDLVPTIQGRGPFTWQWRRDGSDLADATGPSLFIPGAGAANAGRYSVTVTNVVGSMTSGDINVIVRPADRFAGDWTSFGGASDRDGYQPAVLGRHRFQPVWQTQPVAEPPLNPVAVADGTVFFTDGGYHGNMSARAHNLSTGAPLWNHRFANATNIGVPTWHNGRLYIQRANHSSDSQLWCLDAGTGTPLWSAPFSTQLSTYEAPAVSEIGIFTAGGYGSGIYGHDFNGSQRFFRDLPQYDEWTPTISRQRLYTWVEGKFIEHDTQTGLPLWTLDLKGNWPGWTMETVPVVKGARAYLLSPSETLCIDTDNRRVIWRIPRTFFGTPALAIDRLFVQTGGDVVALSTADGSELARYITGASGSLALTGQPLALNDHLIVGNSDKTYVFDIDTAQLVQTIPHGGYPAYSGGYLLIAGTDGILRAYFANAAPVFTQAMPAAIQSGAAADDLMLPLGPYAGDADPGDPLRWAIVSVSRPEVFRTLEIAPQSGDLTVIYNPWQSGTSDVTLSVSDSAGNVTEHTITFTVPQHPEPQLELAAKLVLNRQTGLYEHAITVTNTGAREIAGFDLRISGLPGGVTVNNASARDGNDWIIHHRQPLAAAASVNLVLEYYTPVRGTVINPQVAVGIVTVPVAHPDAPEGGLAVERCIVMAGGSVMIEFTTTPGALYEIHYSDDAADWKLSPVRVRAAGNRVQWIDSGPPRTATPPSGEPCRFYRVRELPQP
jgi:outer membrane protein assembly factor BamB